MTLLSSSSTSLPIVANHFSFNKTSIYFLTLFLFLSFVSFAIMYLNVIAELHERYQRCSPITFFWNGGNTNACAKKMNETAAQVVKEYNQPPPKLEEKKGSSSSFKESFVSSLCATPENKYISVVTSLGNAGRQVQNTYEWVLEQIIFFQNLLKSYIWIVYTHHSLI